jgi:hypothetical protein
VMLSICGTVTVAVARLRAALALKLSWGGLLFDSLMVLVCFLMFRESAVAVSLGAEAGGPLDNSSWGDALRDPALSSRRTFSRTIGDFFGLQSSLDVGTLIARKRVPSKDGASPYPEPLLIPYPEHPAGGSEQQPHPDELNRHAGHEHQQPRPSLVEERRDVPAADDVEIGRIEHLR